MERIGDWGGLSRLQGENLVDVARLSTIGFMVAAPIVTVDATTALANQVQAKVAIADDF